MPEGLGRLYDIGSVTVPTDAVAGAITGARTCLRDAGGVDFIVITTGASTDVLDVDLQQYQASTGGSALDLDIITSYYYRSETTLDGDEQWVKGTQAAASEITNVGGASTEVILVVSVEAEQLADGYQFVALDVPDQGTNGTKHVTIIPILRDLTVQRDPRNMPLPLRP